MGTRPQVKLLAYEALVFDYRFYPRQSVDAYHVTAIKDAIEGGATVPPVRVATDYRVIDGWHRSRAWHGLRREVPCEVCQYATEAEMFANAVKLNRDHGLPYDAHDRRRIFELGSKNFGMHESDLVELLHVPAEKIKLLTKGWARGPQGERVALKRPVLHLSGSEITPEQASEISGPMQGTSYGYLVRRVVRALELDLLPSPQQDAGLWEALAQLRELLLQKLAA